MALFIIGCNSSGTGGIDITSYITKEGYKITHSKLWSSDTGRSSMTGENKGTFIGIFPKFTIQVGKIKTDKNKATAILQIVNSATFNCKYYDPESQTMKVASFYAGDVSETVISAKSISVVIEPFSIIANARRT